MGREAVRLSPKDGRKHWADLDDVGGGMTCYYDGDYLDSYGVHEVNLMVVLLLDEMRTKESYHVGQSQTCQIDHPD